MLNDLEKLKKNKKKYFKSIYNTPENYFNDLSPRIENRIDSLESKKTKIVLINQLFKVAAIFLLLIGFFYLLNLPYKDENINYVHLNEYIDDYLAVENELFYTFIYEEDLNSLNIEKNIDDYLEIEIDFNP